MLSKHTVHGWGVPTGSSYSAGCNVPLVRGSDVAALNIAGSHVSLGGGDVAGSYVAALDVAGGHVPLVRSSNVAALDIAGSNIPLVRGSNVATRNIAGSLANG
jgi:hypothetical protein